MRKRDSDSRFRLLGRPTLQIDKVSANGRLQRWPIGRRRASQPPNPEQGRGPVRPTRRSAPLFRGSETGLPRPYGRFGALGGACSASGRPGECGGSPRRHPISAYHALAGPARIEVVRGNHSALPGAAASPLGAGQARDRRREGNGFGDFGQGTASNKTTPAAGAATSKSPSFVASGKRRQMANAR